jgi:hypothetical protein
MPTTTFSASHFSKLLQVNSYAFSGTAITLFGIRGAKIISANADIFKDSHQIESATVNYTTPNCIIGIWDALQNKIALFPASTVPHLHYIKKQAAKKGAANCMMSGFYSFFEKGFHNPSEASRHQALRLATNIVLRRSFNDFAFDNTDTIEVGNPHDNMHAAYCDNANSAYSSAGCQVIVGQPKCKKRNMKENTLFWKKFHDFIYSIPQNNFDYALFRFADAQAASLANNDMMQARLRFGSKGNLVLQLQQSLQVAGFFGTSPDGNFGKNTLLAVIDFQKQTFGLQNADGVVGNATATALGITLPTI